MMVATITTMLFALLLKLLSERSSCALARAAGRRCRAR
jgi:hypothetical protein